MSAGDSDQSLGVRRVDRCALMGLSGPSGGGGPMDSAGRRWQGRRSVPVPCGVPLRVRGRLHGCVTCVRVCVYVHIVNRKKNKTFYILRDHKKEIRLLYTA